MIQKWRRFASVGYSQLQMRRGLAITIALLFSLSLAAPLFASESTSSLPACCRRNGSHHCAAGISAPSTVTAFSAIAPKCPNWPKSTPAPRPHDSGFSPAVGAVSALYALPLSTPQTEALFRIAFARSRQKRGPPTNLL